MCFQRRDTPLGPILMASDGIGLTGLWFEGQKYFSAGFDASAAVEAPDAFSEADRWLDTYFAGSDPGPLPGLHLSGTEFQRRVWQMLTEIPYGTVATYGMLAERLARQTGRLSMSAQAVGNAVGRNPVSVIVPCHRVLGADGSLTGYAGGLWRKRSLLLLENSFHE